MVVFVFISFTLFMWIISFAGGVNKAFSLGSEEVAFRGGFVPRRTWPYLMKYYHLIP